MPRTQVITEQGSSSTVDSKTEAQGRLLRTDVRPPLEEENSCVLEGGDFSHFRRKFVWQVHSSRFVDKPIPRVEYTKEYVERRKDEVGAYRQFAGDSLTVETKDGYGLIVFMKRGMYASVPRAMERSTREYSENAFRNLVNVYPPVVPPTKDRRHIQALEKVKALEEVKASWVEKGLAWGRTQMMYWHENGHPGEPPYVSADANPKDPAQLQAVKEFIKEVSWENEPIGKLMALSDRKSKEKFHNHTQELRRDGLLKHLDQGPHAVNSSIVAIVNMAVQPHRDPKDARDGWTSTNTWGNYEGAWAVFPDLGIMIEQEPGDIMLCRSHYLEHWITEITSGERFCCTRMTKDNVINALEKWVRCPVPGCDWTSGRVSSLRHHVGTYHFDLTDAEVESIMDNIPTGFPEYNDKDINVISSAFRSRMVEQELKEKKERAKMEAQREAT